MPTAAVREISVLGERHLGGAPGLRPLLRPSARSAALVAYLALHPDLPQPREAIAAAFWPDSTETQARTNLRRELHLLRQLLDDEPSLVVQPATLTWRETPTCRVDVLTFVRERQLAWATDDDDVRVAHARAAVSVYRGDLLPGLYDEWILETRERMRRECGGLLGEVARLLSDRGDAAAAVDFARRRVAIEPFDEATYRSLMMLQAEIGDRGAALTTFHRCASMLERELGVAPSDETVAVSERLLSRHPRRRTLQATPAAAPGRRSGHGASR